MIQLKPLLLSLTLAQVATFVSATASTTNGQDYWQSFKSNINPLNVTLPKITQTVSISPTQECTYYNPDTSLFTIDPTEWPSIWDVATTNGMNTSAEFTALYNSIDWTKAPNIPVRTISPSGGLDFTGYDANADPDCWWSSSVCTVPKIADVNPDIYYCPEPETWGLTYDDGPNCSHNAFYDYLEEQKLTASMFYIGSNVLDWPYGAMRGIRDGHHIASHTWSHPMVTTLTNQEVLAEFYYTQKAIKLVTGVTPRYWRPPYGDVDDRVRWIASQLGLTAIIWNLDTDDWAAGVTTTVAAVEQSYTDFITMGNNGTFANSGNIVLTHEINNETMSLALQNLPAIRQSYKHVIDVATCQNITYPYFENTVSFQSFSQYLGLNTTTTTTPSGSSSLSLSSASAPSGSSSSSGAAGKISSLSSTSSSTSSSVRLSPAAYVSVAFIAALGLLI